MSTNTTPADMLLSWPLFWSIIEGGPSILSLPSHLKDVGTILQRLDTQTAPERATPQVYDKLFRCQTKGFLLRFAQFGVVAAKVW